MKHVHRILFLLAAAWAVFPLHIYNYLGFLWMMVGLVQSILHYKNTSYRPSVLLILTLPALVGFIGYYAPAIPPIRASATLSHTLHLALMPVGLALYRPFSENWQRDTTAFLRIYAASFTVAMLYFNFRILAGDAWGDPAFGLPETHDVQTIYRNIFISVSGHHPTYFSIMGWFAAAVLMIEPDLIPLQKWRWIAVAVILLLTLALGSRMPMIAAVIAWLALRWRAIWNHPSARWGFFGLLLLGGILMIPRWNEMVSLMEAGPINSASIRLQIAHCWWEQWSASPWFGYGTGASLDQLQSCYREREFIEAFQHHLNPHNQYAHWLLDWGLVGTGAIFAAGAMIWGRWSPHCHELLRFFLIFCTLSWFTESVLNRQLGIVFTGLLFSFLVMYNKPHHPSA